MREGEAPIGDSYLSDNQDKELIQITISSITKSYLNLYRGSFEAEGVLEAFRGSKLFCFHFLYLACSLRSLAIAEPMPEFNFSSCSASR